MPRPIIRRACSMPGGLVTSSVKALPYQSYASQMSALGSGAGFRAGLTHSGILLNDMESIGAQIGLGAEDASQGGAVLCSCMQAPTSLPRSVHLSGSVCVCVIPTRRAVPPGVPTPLETYVARGVTVLTHSPRGHVPLSTTVSQ